MAVAPRPWQTPQLPAPKRRRQPTPQIPPRAFQPLPPSPVIRKAATFQAATATRSSVRTSLVIFAMGHRFTQFLAIAGIISAVSLYAYTVYSQKVWSNAYSELSRLQNDEREFVTNTESIKEQLIEQSSQPESTLVAPKPENNLYVPEPKAVKLLPQTAPNTKPIYNTGPIGY